MRVHDCDEAFGDHPIDRVGEHIFCDVVSSGRALQIAVAVGLRSVSTYSFTGITHTKRNFGSRAGTAKGSAPCCRLYAIWPRCLFRPAPTASFHSATYERVDG